MRVNLFNTYYSLNKKQTEAVHEAQSALRSQYECFKIIFGLYNSYHYDTR